MEDRAIRDDGDLCRTGCKRNLSYISTSDFNPLCYWLSRPPSPVHSTSSTEVWRATGGLLQVFVRICRFRQISRDRGISLVSTSLGMNTVSVTVYHAVSYTWVAILTPPSPRAGCPGQHDRRFRMH